MPKVRIHFVLTLVTLTAAALGCHEVCGAPCERAAARNPYGDWITQSTFGGAFPAFRYRGPVTTAQLDSQGNATIPLHHFGNAAWSGFADAAGRVRMFQRSAGPTMIGSDVGSGWLLLECPDGRRITRRDAAVTDPARQGTATVEFHASGARYNIRYLAANGATEPARSVRSDVRIATQGAELVVQHHLTHFDPSCAVWSLWDLTPIPLSLTLVAGGDAAASIAEDRLNQARKYAASLERNGNTITARFIPPNNAATAPPDSDILLPQALTLYVAAGPVSDVRVLDRTQIDQPEAGAALAADKIDVELPLLVAIRHAPTTTANEDDVIVRLVMTPAAAAETIAPIAAAPAWAPFPVHLTAPAAAAISTGVDAATFERELKWHAAQLAAGAAWDSAYSAAVVDQGSAYLYVQGGSGAVRDFALNAIALIPVQPELARDTLRTAMQWTQPSGQMYYLGSGWGDLSDAAIRGESTDLDLFLLWALVRYLGLTRDLDFLDEVVAYSDGSTSSVRTRLLQAVDHVTQVTGLGSNGWLRVGTGDWSDGILLFSSDPGLTRERGESMFNTLMALYVLPQVQPWLAQIEASKAAALQTWLADLRTAALQAWRGEWFVRGSFGDGDFLGEDQIFLESNQWALLAGVGSPEQQRALLAAILRELDTPEPLGARLVFPPSEQAAAFLVPGWDVNGGTWPAMHGIAVPAYAAVDPAEAWRLLLEASMANHAVVYPQIWYGIWTGPDSYNAAYAERPGETFVHLATPMIDFPAANMNIHSGPLVAVEHLVGLMPAPDGVILAPRMPVADWTYETVLVRIDWGATSISLTFKGTAQPGDTWQVAPPAAWALVCDNTGATLNPDASGRVRLPLGSAVLAPCG